jgi:hypothetical protein
VDRRFERSVASYQLMSFQSYFAIGRRHRHTLQTLCFIVMSWHWVVSYA